MNYIWNLEQQVTLLLFFNEYVVHNVIWWKERMQLLSLFTLPQAQNVVVLFKRFNFIYSSPSNINAFNMYIKQFIKVFFWAHYFCCGSLTVQYLKKYCMIFQTKPEIYGNRYLLTVNKIVVVLLVWMNVVISI